MPKQPKITVPLLGEKHTQHRFNKTIFRLGIYPPLTYNDEKEVSLVIFGMPLNYQLLSQSLLTNRKSHISKTPKTLKVNRTKVFQTLCSFTLRSKIQPLSLFFLGGFLQLKRAPFVALKAKKGKPPCSNPAGQIVPIWKGGFLTAGVVSKTEM